MHGNWLQTAVLHLNSFRKAFLGINNPALFPTAPVSYKTFHNIKSFSEFRNNKPQQAALQQLWKSPPIFSTYLIKKFARSIQSNQKLLSHIFWWWCYSIDTTQLENDNMITKTLWYQ